MAQPEVRPVTRRRAGRRAGRSRTDLLIGAAAVIAERGADATRFVDVSAACGVPVSSLQYYFGSREDLLVAAFRHASDTELAQLRAELPGIVDPWDRLVRIVDAALGGFADGAGESGRLWVESWRFALRDCLRHHDVALVNWQLIKGDGTSSNTGYDFVQFAPSGQIAKITGFFAKPPAPVPS